MIRVIRVIVVWEVAWLVLGCSFRPGVYVYPQRGQTAEQLSRDQRECEAWAAQQTGFNPVEDTILGAGLGGLVGAAAGAGLGAATGSPGKGAKIGGTAGGLVGGLAGYAQSRDGYNRAYAVCMQGRGYLAR